MEFVKFSEYGKGTLSSMLADAYSRNRELVNRHGADWEEFDAFVFENPDVMDRNGFVSIEGSRPVGFMSWDSRHLPDRVEIGHNCIINEFKGKGLGKEQLLHGLELIKSLAPGKITVKTGNVPFFLPARRMYESAGFRPTRKTRQHEEAVPEIIEYELLL